MSRCKKTIISAAFLVILSLPGMVFLHFQVMHLQIEYQMEERLETEYMQTVRIPVNKIQWYKKNREIIIGGRLFDVQSVTIENQVAIFKGLFDIKETTIKEKINQLQEQQANDKGNQSLVAKFASFLLIQQDGMPRSLQCTIASAVPFNQYHPVQLLGAGLSTPAPPPKI